MTQLSSSSADCRNIFRCLNKRLTDSIYALLHGKFKATTVVISKGADTEVDTGQINALAGAQFTTDLHRAPDILFICSDNFQLYDSVIQKQYIPFFHNLRQTVKAY